MNIIILYSQYFLLYIYWFFFLNLHTSQLFISWFYLFCCECGRQLCFYQPYSIIFLPTITNHSLVSPTAPLDRMPLLSPRTAHRVLIVELQRLQFICTQHTTSKACFHWHMALEHLSLTKCSPLSVASETLALAAKQVLGREMPLTLTSWLTTHR